MLSQLMNANQSLSLPNTAQIESKSHRSCVLDTSGCIASEIKDHILLWGSWRGAGLHLPHGSSSTSAGAKRTRRGLPGRHNS